MPSFEDLDRGQRGPIPIDWGEFWTDDPAEEDWEVEPLIPRGRSVAVASPAKQGKSLLALELAVKRAIGAPVLSQPAGDPIDVIYLDLEMGRDDLRERLEAMGIGPEIDLSRFHYFQPTSLKPLDTKVGADELIELVNRFNAKLVIVDTTARVIGGAENDADTINDLFSYCIRPIKALGCTFVRLDHVGKSPGRGQRGTSAKDDDVDVVWQLTTKGDRIVLKSTHRRQEWIPPEIALSRQGNPLRHVLVEASDPEGTDACIELLNQLGIPLSTGRKLAGKTVRDAGYRISTDVLAAAIRKRKARCFSERATSGTPTADDQRTSVSDTCRSTLADTRPDTLGQVSEATGSVPPSIDGDTSQPGLPMDT
ncbi:MAG: AAA family ATPase [Dehalococcoidia bacterium]